MGNFGKIIAAKALKSCPKWNKLPNLVTLVLTPKCLFLGYPLPEGAEQGDVERRRQLDDHQHRQGRVPVLRGHGSSSKPGHSGPCRPFSSREFTNLSFQFLCETDTQVRFSTLPQM